MRRTLVSRAFIGIVAAGTLLLGPAPAQGATSGAVVDQTFVVVDASPGEQTDPHISGSLVAYTSDLNGSSEVRYFDLATGAGAPIPTDGDQDLLADVHGSTVVLSRFVQSGHSHIRSFDASAGGPSVEIDPQPLPLPPPARQNPSIGAETVVWEDYGLVPSPTAMPEIVAYDRASAATTRLTTDLLPDLDAALSPSGTLAVWAKCTPSGTNCDIWQAARAGTVWTTSALTSDGSTADNASPDTDGQVIAYQSNRPGNLDIYWQTVGGRDQQLALPGIQRNPNVSGGLISFESQDTINGNFDVALYDTATDTLYSLTQTADQSEQLNDVSVSGDGLVRVVYSRLGPDGDFDVHATSFRLASGNLLRNPGFELDANGDERPDSWTTTHRFTRSSAVVAQGAYSGRHRASDESAYAVSQGVAVTGLTAYRFSGQVNVPATRDRFAFGMAVRWLDSRGATVGIAQLGRGFSGPTGGWTPVQAGVTAPARATRAEIAMVAAGLSAMVYVDDFFFGAE